MGGHVDKFCSAVGHGQMPVDLAIAHGQAVRSGDSDYHLSRTACGHCLTVPKEWAACYRQLLSFFHPSPTASFSFKHRGVKGRAIGTQRASSRTPAVSFALDRHNSSTRLINLGTHQTSPSTILAFWPVQRLTVLGQGAGACVSSLCEGGHVLGVLAPPETMAQRVTVQTTRPAHSVPSVCFLVFYT